MPNWCDNYLTILVPRKNLQALKADLAGPCTWWHPVAAVNGGGRLDESVISNHQILQIDSDPEGTIVQVKKSWHTNDTPDWMPVSRLDVVATFSNVENHMADQVPFSIPKLLPWADRSEFDTFFPSVIIDGYWAVDPERVDDYNSGRVGSIGAANAKIGTKWPPSSVELSDEDSGGGSGGDDEMVDLHYRYQTPWGPVSDLEYVMKDVLEKHGARMCLIWLEDNHAGFNYANPALDVYLSEDFGSDVPLTSVPDEFDDGEEYTQIDREALVSRIADSIDDPDMPVRL